MSAKDPYKWSKRKLCSAINCKNYQCGNAHLAFHHFPNDPDRCARWVQNLRNASLIGISTQRLHQSYRVCSAHFHPSQFKRPSDVHAGLKWNAVPTRIDAPNPPLPLDLETRRKAPKKRQVLLPKKWKQSHAAPLSNVGSSVADSVADRQLTGSETDLTALDADAAVAGPSMPITPLPALHLEAATKERALKMKIRSLQSQVCKLRAKVRELKHLNKTNRAGVSKESVMKHLRKILPAKAYAFKLMRSIDFKPGFNHNILATMKKAQTPAVHDIHAPVEDT
ncbi:hypothetical protein GJAV_G00071910 [Gymnothorax javanicus]|nr:hypothetical protein GJAV_G00071910 [Gymnothorax javanicus]